MPEKKKKEPEKKKSLRGEELRKAIEEMQKFRDMTKPPKASPTKKSVPKKEESWVAKLKSKVQAYFKAQKKEKKPLVTERTRQIQQQLAKAGVKGKTDQERAEEKRKKAGHNPGSTHNSSKKKSGY